MYSKTNLRLLGLIEEVLVVNVRGCHGLEINNRYEIWFDDFSVYDTQLGAFIEGEWVNELAHIYELYENQMARQELNKTNYRRAELNATQSKPSRPTVDPRLASALSKYK